MVATASRYGTRRPKRSFCLIPFSRADYLAVDRPTHPAHFRVRIKPCFPARNNDRSALWRTEVKLARQSGYG